MSKLILFDFSCKDCGYTFEELACPMTRETECPSCEGAALRQISPVRIDRYGMALQDGATPTSIGYFEKVHRDRKAQEDRAFERNGDYGTHAGGDGGRPITPQIAASL